MKHTTILKYLQTKCAAEPSLEMYRNLMDSQMRRGEEDPRVIADPSYTRRTFDASRQNLEEYARKIKDFLEYVPTRDEEITPATPLSRRGYAPFFDQLRPVPLERGFKLTITPRKFLEAVHGKERAAEIIRTIFEAKAKYPMPRDARLSKIYQILHENLDRPVDIYLAGPPENPAFGLPPLSPGTAGLTPLLPAMGGRPLTFLFEVPNELKTRFGVPILSPEQRSGFVVEVPLHELMHAILAQRLATARELQSYVTDPSIARTAVKKNLPSPYLRQQAEMDAFLTALRHIWHLSGNPIVRTPADVETMLKVFDDYLMEHLTYPQRIYRELYQRSSEPEKMEIRSRILQLLGKADESPETLNA